VTATDLEQGVACLVRRIIAGEAAAENELVTLYSRAIRALIARRAPQPDDAEDLYQQTMLTVLQKIRRGALRDPERLSGFVCSVARNVTTDFVRRPRLVRPLEFEAEPRASSPDPLHQTLERESGLQVREALRGLRPRDREILRRFYLAEETKADICRQMQLESKQFDQVIFHARLRLRRIFEAPQGTA
jgi:RNA polymerase sigma-70 factor (ECF subfamily)